MEGTDQQRFGRDAKILLYTLLGFLQKHHGSTRFPTSRIPIVMKLYMHIDVPALTSKHVLTFPQNLTKD